AVGLEAEAAGGVVELRRRDAEIEEEAVAGGEAARVVALLRGEAVAVLREARAGGLEGTRIAVDADDAGSGLEQRFGVAASSECSVDDQLACFRFQELHRLGEEDG